uniref:Uncharacterized protein n=1 Tax=Emiliania huxleyi TaxID=2903 RepID=A0A6V2N385_EMIHU
MCRLNLASSLLALRRWREARDACGRVLAADPRNVKALYRRAQARLELDDLTGAASDLATAISLRGSDPALLRLRRRLQSVSRERQATAEGFASGGAAGGEQSQDASPDDSGESVEGESGEEQSGEGESIDRSDESDDDDESGEEEEAAVAAPSGSFRFNFDHS